MAGLLVVRRTVGGLTQPLDAPAVLLTAVMLAAYAMAARWTWLLSGSIQPRWHIHIVRWVPGTVVILIAWSISLPATPFLALVLLWGILFVEEVVTLYGASQLASRDKIELTRSPPPFYKGGEHDTRPGDNSVPSAVDETDISSFPDHLHQQITHARNEHGEVVVYGRVRGEFAERQRSTSVHIAFCPPLETTPELLVHQVDGPEVTVKPAQVLPYGVRLDLKLKTIGQQRQTVVVQFSARTR